MVVHLVIKKLHLGVKKIGVALFNGSAELKFCCIFPDVLCTQHYMTVQLSVTCPFLLFLLKCLFGAITWH